MSLQKIKKIFYALAGISFFKQQLVGFPLDLNTYPEIPGASLWEQLSSRVAVDPFNLVVTIIFACAILHTFLASKIHNLALAVTRKKIRRIKVLKEQKIIDQNTPEHSFLGVMLIFLGEVEIVLSLWVIVLGVAFTWQKDWGTFLAYLENDISYSEPLFVMVIMTLAATKPITYSAEYIINFFATKLNWLLRSSSGAFWYTTLTLGPFLGSIITEVAAITICSLLLIESIFKHPTSNKLRYITLGILLVNISIGGALTNYAAPVIFIVATPWNITTPYMLANFGWKIVSVVILCTSIAFIILRKEFTKLDKYKKDNNIDTAITTSRIPLWVVMVHYAFILWSVINLHHAVLFIGGYLIMIGFIAATAPYQRNLDMRTPLLIGLFIAGLLIHGGLQGWWISPLLSQFSYHAIFWISAGLSTFNDNASVTYISSLSPYISEAGKLAILGGAIASGGLTILANAPNPTAFSLLKKYFDNDTISHFWLFISALIPTIIVLFFFYYL